MTGEVDTLAEVKKLWEFLSPAEQAEFDLLQSQSPPDFMSGTFPEQLAFIQDKSALKLAFCTRRASKSTSIGINALDILWKNPKMSGLITGHTREEVKRIYWEPILIAQAEKHGCLDPGNPARYCKFNISDLSIQLPNRSILYLLGTDANEKEMRKALGQKWKFAAVDEAQDFTNDIKKLIYDVLQPATMDNRGQIVLGGTPSDALTGHFYELTTGHEAAVTMRWQMPYPDKGAVWSCHSWGSEKNPYVRQEQAELIATMRRNNPNIDTTTSFMQQYMGKWVVDKDNKIYAYVPGHNDFSPQGLERLLLQLIGDPKTILPQAVIPFAAQEWRFMLGCDLGFNDATAIVVVAWTPGSPILYIVESWSRSSMDFQDTADALKVFLGKYDVSRIVVDGANKQGVETMRKRYGLSGLESADKTDKMHYIKMMNADYLAGHIKLSPFCASLKAEYDKLVKDPNSVLIKKEHPGRPNHCCDAALYAWRAAYNWTHQEEEKAPPRNSPEGLRAEAKRMLELARSQNEDRVREMKESWS